MVYKLGMWEAQYVKQCEDQKVKDHKVKRRGSTKTSNMSRKRNPVV